MGIIALAAPQRLLCTYLSRTYYTVRMEAHPSRLEPRFRNGAEDEDEPEQDVLRGRGEDKEDGEDLNLTSHNVLGCKWRRASYSRSGGSRITWNIDRRDRQ